MRSHTQDRISGRASFGPSELRFAVSSYPARANPCHGRGSAPQRVLFSSRAREQPVAAQERRSGMPERNGQTDLRERPVGELMKELSEQTTTLVRREIELAKAELSAK